MSIWNRLFGKAEVPQETEPIYNFIDVNASDLASYSDGLRQLQQRSIDGFLIRDAFPPEEVETLRKSFDAVLDDKLMKADSGLNIYPEAFSYASQLEVGSPDFDAFFERCEDWWQEVETNQSINFPERLLDLVNGIADGFEMRIPKGPNGRGKFSLANFRRVVPGKGSFKPHCGNFFHQEFPQIYSLIEHFSDPKNQFSYFLCLEAPKTGGELMLYDVEWREAKVRMPEETILKTEDGKLIDLRSNELRKQAIRPREGDVVLFAGGEIWHEVMTIPEGDKRLTLGGFLSRSHDGKSYYLWS